MQKEIFHVFDIKQYKWYDLKLVWKLHAFKFKTTSCPQQQRRADAFLLYCYHIIMQILEGCSISLFLVNYIIQEPLQTSCQVVKSCTDDNLYFFVTASTFAVRLPQELKLRRQFRAPQSQIPAVSSTKAHSPLITAGS